VRPALGPHFDPALIDPIEDAKLEFQNYAFVSTLPFPFPHSAWPSACSADSSPPSPLRHLPVSGRRFLLLPIPRLVSTPCSSSLSFPIWPPVETFRLGDISIVVTSSLGDISVAAWGHYQSRATCFSGLNSALSRWLVCRVFHSGAGRRLVRRKFCAVRGAGFCLKGFSEQLLRSEPRGAACGGRGDRQQRRTALCAAHLR